MKTKLIQTKDYLLFIDEEAETCEYYLHMSINGRHQIYSYKENESNFEKGQQIKWCSKIVAYYPLTKKAKELDLPLLPNPFKEEIDTNVQTRNFNKQVKNPYSNYDKEYQIWERAYIEGFDDGVSQDKQFSLEDIKKAIEMAQEVDLDSVSPLYTKEEIIQSLSTQQLPSEFILGQGETIEEQIKNGHYE